MAITRITMASAQDAVDTITSRLNTGGAGKIDIMDGIMPSSADTAITTQKVLATLPLSNPAFAAATDEGAYAEAVANAITDDDNAAVAGTATWFRAYNGAGTAIIDGDVGIGTEAMTINNVSIAVNDTIKANSWTIRLDK